MKATKILKFRFVVIHGSIEDTTHLHVYKGTIESGKFKLKVLQSFNLNTGKDLIESIN